MAAAIPFIIAATAVVSAVSAIKQGQAAKAAAEYNAKINEQNATIARQQSLEQAKQADRETYLRLGAIRADAGKNGGASGTGSVLDILGDTAAQSELAKQDILYRGELQARGYTNTSTLDTYSGNTAQSGSYLKAGSELLSGAANTYTTYSKLNRS